MQSKLNASGQRKNKKANREAKYNIEIRARNMSSTLQNATKKGDVNISKKVAKDHYHAQTENETQKANY